jgi:hypothetical protein
LDAAVPKIVYLLLSLMIYLSITGDDCCLPIVATTMDKEMVDKHSKGTPDYQQDDWQNMQELWGSITKSRFDFIGCLESLLLIKEKVESQPFTERSSYKAMLVQPGSFSEIEIQSTLDELRANDVSLKTKTYEWMMKYSWKKSSALSLTAFAVSNINFLRKRLSKEKFHKYNVGKGKPGFRRTYEQFFANTPYSNLTDMIWDVHQIITQAKTKMDCPSSLPKNSDGSTTELAQNVTTTYNHKKGSLEDTKLTIPKCNLKNETEDSVSTKVDAGHVSTQNDNIFSDQSAGDHSAKNRGLSMDDSNTDITWDLVSSKVDAGSVATQNDTLFGGHKQTLSSDHSVDHSPPTNTKRDSIHGMYQPSTIAKTRETRVAENLQKSSSTICAMDENPITDLTKKT